MRRARRTVSGELLPPPGEPEALLRAEAAEETAERSQEE